MKITRDLPQFRSKNALIVTAGLHTADFYVASNGEIEMTGEFKMLYPHYSDKEGFFESAGHGHVFESGSVLETNKAKFRHRFLKELDLLIDDTIIRKEVTDVYLFAPDFVTSELLKLLPKKDKKQVRYFFKGNYIHVHPFYLLKLIKEKENLGWKIPLKEEARKILGKPIIVKGKKGRK